MKKWLIGLLFAAAVYAAPALAAVNVNTAGASQLETLDGIGAVKAQAIVKDREANGKYQSLDEMTRVDGIGPKTVEGIRSEATVDTPSGDDSAG